MPWSGKHRVDRPALEASAECGRGWQREILAYLGIPPAHVITSGDGTVRCNRLLYTPMLRRNSRSPLCNPNLLLSIKRLVEQHLAQPMFNRTAIFISRRDAPDRYLRNEDAVFERLRLIYPTMEAVVLKGMSVKAQAALFRQASVIIGPHGQAFHNALFAQDSLIVQLSHGAHFSRSVWCDAFNVLALLGNNQSITLYSETTQDNNSKLSCSFQNRNSL